MPGNSEDQEIRKIMVFVRKRIIVDKVTSGITV